MNDIHILLIGTEDWNLTHDLPEYIKLECHQTVTKELSGLFDLLILDRDITKNELPILRKSTKAHCLFVTENAKMTTFTKELFDGKVGTRLYTGDIDAFMKEESINFYTEPYGEKFNADFLTINQLFDGDIEYNGQYDVRLKGNFGEDFEQIAFWKCNIPIFEDQCIDIYFEHKKTEGVEVKLRMVQFYNGAIGDVQQIWEFDEEELKGIVRLDNKKGTGPVFASVLAKGQGELQIVNLHDRYSRRDFGYFLPGGDRYVTSKGEEVFCYFDPADMKPPLAYYFSGWRKQEGFEGYFMMRKLGCPFVLVTDPRLEGGAFYLGDEEYESMVLKALRSYMNRLGFDSSQIILSGNSMGTFGSMYYGCRLLPHAFILGKPLPNLGDVAENERINRPHVFKTSLEVLQKSTGSLDFENIAKLNERFWERFDYADWQNTKFIISYLYEDDYDMNGYRDILAHLKSSGVQVYGKGVHGRHNDNTNVVVQWFKSQYNKLLIEDFGRK